MVGSAVVELEKEEDGAVSDLDLLSLPNSMQKETYRDVKIGDNLTVGQRAEVENLLAEFSDIFSDVPKLTNLVEHDIQLTSDVPIRSPPYVAPHALRKIIEKEIDDMIKLDIIEPCKSAYASPVVLVKKPDGSYRFCVDYRKLNQITVFDAEPMPRATEIYSQLTPCRFFSKFDLSKGFWQVGLTERSRDMSAMATHRGLYRFKVLPFGLVTASATCNRLLRAVLGNMSHAFGYMDDVIAGTPSWQHHLKGCREFFQRIREANLTLRPSKCQVGFESLDFLGLTVGDGSLSTNPTKIQNILRLARPTSKTQVKAFLGMVNFYRVFLPKLSEISIPLIDLVKKGKPNIVNWGEEQEKAFLTLKTMLSKPPVLRLPNFNLPFVLQTDASEVGVAALLCQEYEGMLCPVAYASKRLLDRETRYSTIDREALAIVWSVNKFRYYLYGQHFILDTDHQPLLYLQRSQNENPRLTRWSLALQSYHFSLRSIRGMDNQIADCMSRLPMA